jgi:hypothetical protein
VGLNFPNGSRSYDARRQAVGFWGYDGAMEVSFLVTAEALRALNAPSADERALLNAFDAHCGEIRTPASKFYKRKCRGSYELTESNALESETMVVGEQCKDVCSAEEAGLNAPAN